MEPFVHTALLWGLPVVGVPVLIHLINLLRHRRIRWAAMEFLLLSQRKNRTWVTLKQLLLLLARMAAVALVVLMVAEPRLAGQWNRLFGGRSTHYVVLLDDSYSMSDSWESTSAFEQAKAVVQQIGKAMTEEGPQRFTLLRFSRARPSPYPLPKGEGTSASLPKGEGSSAGPQADLFEITMDAKFGERLDAMVAGWRPSQSAAGPAAAIEAIDQLLAGSTDADCIVYIVSDFRARDWEDAAGTTGTAVVRDRLVAWKQAGRKVHLVNCVDAARPNLAIAELSPSPGTWAAGVFSFMDVAVRNYGAKPARNVPVLVETDGRAQPAITIPQIPPRGTVRERFSVRFTTAGEHRVEARLEPDSVAADNSRYAVLEVASELPVLLIDGDPAGRDARYLSAVFAPGGPVATGINPRIENPRYLDSHPVEQFRAIYLMNVDQLDEPAVAALEKYVADGGGAAFFLGERTQSLFVNRRLYREGKGLFPVPLGAPEDLPPDYLQRQPDLGVLKHRIFDVFAGERNSFLPLVNVFRYWAVPRGWKADAEKDVEVIATLRNKAPLAVERRFGRGRVIAFLTTAAPVWNNWARENPSFIVAMLELQAYLGGGRRPRESCLVGEPLKFSLDAGQYAPQVRFTKPAGDRRTGSGFRVQGSEDQSSDPGRVGPVDGQGSRSVQDGLQTRPTGDGLEPRATTIVVDAPFGPDGKLAVVLEDTEVAGLYEAALQLTKTNSEPGRADPKSESGRVGPKEEVRHYAVNVDPAEGDLRTLWGPDLAARLKDTDCEFHQAASFRYAGEERAGSNLSLAILFVLIGLLVGEQLLAYSASYHLPASGRDTGLRGRDWGPGTREWERGAESLAPSPHPRSPGGLA